MRELAKSLAYGAIDLCTGYRGIERVISGEPIRFPARWCRYYPRDYEPDKFAFLRRHCGPGDTVLDIGAHIGLFTVFMARLVGARGRVFSFEPTPLTRRVLTQTVRINHCDRVVQVRGEALSRTSGTARFYDTGAPLSNANSLVAESRTVTSFEVPTLSVDDFVAREGAPIRVLKIDAEGGEREILEGARQTLRRDRPAVQLEVHPAPLARQPGALQAIWDLARDEGMRIEHNGRVVDETWFTSLTDAVELQLLPV